MVDKLEEERESLIYLGTLIIRIEHLQQRLKEETDKHVKKFNSDNDN